MSPQLPHGLPPTSLSLETEVEKLFLQDPSWLPIHDTDFAFQKFPKYIFLRTDDLYYFVRLCEMHFISCTPHFYIESPGRLSCGVLIFLRVTERKVNADSLLHCAPSALHSGLSVVRDPTTGMLMDFTEVCCKEPFFKKKKKQSCKYVTRRVDVHTFLWSFPP